MASLLIIGASSGIGAAIAQQAQADDWQVLSISRASSNSNHTRHYPCDVLTDALPQIDEPLRGLIYCPGSIHLKPFANLKAEDFRRDFELNVVGAVRCLQHFQSNLQASQAASVVLFSTVAVQTGFSFHTSVATSKGGIEGLTRALAAEWAPKIRVNAIAPSLTETPLAQHLLQQDSKKQAAALRHPLKRLGQASDIANMALFLLSDKASWITGQILSVDGGVSSIRL